MFLVRLVFFFFSKHGNILIIFLFLLNIIFVYCKIFPTVWNIQNKEKFSHYTWRWLVWCVSSQSFLLCIYIELICAFSIKRDHILHCCCSVIQSCPTLRPHGLQHARLPCPSPSPRVCSNSCPLNWWCHPTILSSVIPFSCLQSFPSSESFPVVSSSHQVAKYWGFSFSISPSSEYSGLISFRFDWFDLLAVQGTLKSLLQHHRSKHQVFSAQLSL